MAFDFKKEYKEFYMPKNKPQSRIVAGINCSEDNKKKLNEISNSLGLGNVYTSRIHPEQYTIDYVR